MRVIVATIGVIAGIFFGLYMGLYVCLIGGIVDILSEVVEAVGGDQISAFALVVGVVKIGFSGFIGYLSAFVLIIPSAALFGLSTKANKVHKEKR